MIVMLLTEHHLEFLSLKGGCRGSSEYTLVKMSNCWKSHAAAQMFTLQFSTLLAMSCSSDRQISMVYLKIFLCYFGTKIYLLSFQNPINALSP